MAEIRHKVDNPCPFLLQCPHPNDRTHPLKEMTL